MTAPAAPSHRFARFTAYTLVLVVLLVMAGAITATRIARQPLPQTAGEVQVPGLDAAVHVIRDAHGIPTLIGDSQTDLLRAQGYVHAQERFFEMDVRRHVTAGRLAELFGEAAVETDTFVRTLGWRRVAERELALLTPATRAALEAYADGVNAWLDTHDGADLGVQYTLLRLTGLEYHPEPWTPVDSLAWLKAMAWDLRANLEEEIDRALIAAEIGPGFVDQLHPAYEFDRRAPIVEEGAVIDGAFEPLASEAGTRRPTRAPYTADQVAALSRVRDALHATPEFLGAGSGRRGDGIGSNSWVISAEHSATGAALLANDPHLGVSMPGIWMQMGLQCRTVDEDCPLHVSGFTFAGLPGVVIGHNADIAWGFTNLGADVTDLYLERVEGDQWLYDGEWLDLEIREETIRVHGGDDVTIRVRETSHGPLLSDAADRYADFGADVLDPETSGSGEQYGVSLAWTALEPAPTADAIMALNTASDFAEFRRAARLFAVPAQNLIYADVDGNIGYQAPGRIPIRKSGNDGRMPAAGWQSENDWTPDVIGFDAMPWAYNPESGFIVTANQAVIGPDYVEHLTDDWDRGYRSQRIRNLIESGVRFSIDDLAAMQTDDFHPFAPVLVPHLLDIRLPGGYYAAGQELLADWDFRQPADSAAAAYFNAVWSNLLELVFGDRLPEGQQPDGGQRWFAVMERLLGEPANAWWDDPETVDHIETRDEVLAEALRLARDELTRRLSVDPAEWQWGRLHRLELQDSTLGSSGNPVAEWLLNRGPFWAAGGTSLVNATSWNAAESYRVTAAPSMRMVVAPGDWDSSRWINLTGVSGHPASPHYDDQIDLWLAGETLPWPFTAEAVHEAAAAELRLLPAD
ncbi:penicillin acylase family protein [Nocardioides limicola]|uniref:penicillin acylase family protein n=1 Tax=Nocardioides limicola TaxID=2803368 RepID=UPI00193B698F|nr:penicillin acylase family protein [Nocardioides sp. DJM-14]